jgi:hypothetical protein
MEMACPDKLVESIEPKESCEIKAELNERNFSQNLE